VLPGSQVAAKRERGMEGSKKKNAKERKQRPANDMPEERKNASSNKRTTDEAAAN